MSLQSQITSELFLQGISLSDLLIKTAALQSPMFPENYGDALGVPLQISYRFDETRPDDLRSSRWTDVKGFGSYSASEKLAVRAALDEYEKYIDVRFVEVSSESSFDLAFFKAAEGLNSGRGTYHYDSYPSIEYDGFVVLSTYRDFASTYSFGVILHEIGHALSLKHTGNYDVNPLNAPPGPYLPFEEDNYKFSIMSYLRNPDFDTRPLNLMLYDLPAIQDRWGMNSNYNIGNDTYTFGFDDEPSVIWDSGGIDTIDASNQLNSVIELGQGRFSNIGGKERIAVAYYVNIENAIGGNSWDLISGNFLQNRLEGRSGDDTIKGFEGDDVLEGGQDNDLIDGGDGIDTAAFEGSQSAFTLTLSPDQITISDRRPNGEGTDQLSSIEFLDFGTEIDLFSGNPMNLDIFDGPATLTAPLFSEIIELYIAYFNRAPDALGLFYWATEFTNGFTIQMMAENFFLQPETQATYASVLDDLGNLDITDQTKVEAFVTEVYGNVLGRTPDTPGFNYWVGELLNNPIITPPIFILSIIGGAKFPSEPTAQTAIDQAYLATKSDLGAYFAVIKGMSDIEDASAAMALFDGSELSIGNTIAAMDGHFADALDAFSGDFLMPLVGVIDDPFGVV